MVGLNLLTAIDQIKEEMNSRSSTDSDTTAKQGLMGSALGNNDKPSPFSVILDSLSRLKEKREITQKELSRYNPQLPMSFAGAAVPEITDEDLRRFQSDARIKPMNFSGSVMKERDILESDIMKDVRADAAEKLVEEEETPAVDIAKAIEQDQERQEIDISTLKGKQVGLMAKPSSAVVKDTFVDTFVTAMGKAESTTDHTDPLGIFTLGYGILPATAKANGFDPTETKYKDRSLLAKDVYGKMYQTAKTSYPDVFKGLTDSQKIGVMSLYINSGKLASGVVTALSKSTPDFDGAKKSLASIVLGSPRNVDGSRKKDKNNKTIYTSSKGLSKRRAKEYNILMKSQTNFKPVKTVSVEGTKANPTFVWKDKNNKEIHRYTPTVSGKDKVYQGLDSSNSMKDVSL